MDCFVEIEADRNSIAQRKPVSGIGINDSSYKVRRGADICPYYNVWSAMIRRCYDPKFHEREPTYKDCRVCADWTSFMSFRSWMKTQDWIGKCLDKDIMVPGNKSYDPEFCVFVERNVNNILCDAKNIRGLLPIGVGFHSQTGKYRASVYIDGKKKSLGLFFTPALASSAYNRAKAKNITRVALQQQDHRVVIGLLMHAKLRMKQSIESNCEI